MKHSATGIRFTLIMTVLTGLLYPGIVTGLCRLLFPRQANGSMIVVDNRVVGSALIGQRFTRPEYFHPRPSAAGAGYDTVVSGGSNLGPTSRKLVDRVAASAVEFRKENPQFRDTIPADIVTTSASGLDPHISPAAAEAQVARIAEARHAIPDRIHDLVRSHTIGPDLGILGEPRVSVLELNLALDRLFPRT